MTPEESAPASAQQANPEFPALPDMAVLADNGRDAFAGWIHSNEIVMTGTFDIARQIMSFGQARLEADLQTLKTLVGCRDFKDVAECQRQFAEQAAEQYMDQATKLTRLLTTAMARGAQSETTSNRA